MAAELKASVGIGEPANGYVKTIVVRTGQLNREGMRETVQSAMKAGVVTPFIILSYVLGNDVQVGGDGGVADEPLTFRHDCAFLAMVVASDARGQEVQIVGSAVQPGVIEMAAHVREVLTGLQLKVKVEDEGDDYDANETPLVPAGLEPVDKLPNVSAYAVHFLTSFFWQSKDRRQQPVRLDLINFGIDPLNGEGASSTEAPGVHGSTT
jgi:hypothetical protein